jgi:uncharacterized protein
MVAMVETGLSGAIPARFPIFPLPGARYLHMTRDAMRTDQVIGMVQPCGDASGDQPAIYHVGCVGRIANFAETEDGRYLISLTGLCRYDVLEELTVTTPYRQVVASFERWSRDLEEAVPSDGLRPSLCAALRAYFEVNDISADWAQIEAAPLAGLITSLAMICPFEPSEKQALLEAAGADERCRVLIALLQMGALGDKDMLARH